MAALGPGARQLLEVARAMAHKPKVLMLDEPTAALDMDLAIKLEEIIKRGRDDGTAIVYVSHRLEEVRRLANRLTVIRDGEIQGTHGHSDRKVKEIVEMMVGVPTSLEFPDRKRQVSQTTRLELRDLKGDGFRPVSLTVGSGEIVGLPEGRGMASGDCFAASSASASPGAPSRSMARSSRESLRRPR